MRYFKRILFVLILFVMFIPMVYADSNEDKNLVNIYLFYSDSCIHCASEKELLNEILDDYDNVRLYKYEVSNNKENRDLMLDVANLMDVEVTGVPFTVIADKPFKGFDNEKTKRLFLGTVEFYSNRGYRDIVGEYIGNIELPSYEVTDNSDFYEYIDNYGNYKISFLGFKIDAKSLSLLNLSMLMGFLDGISLIRILTLLFVIGILININDKRTMWLLGFVFIGIYTLINLFCLNISLNIENDLGSIKIILGIISIMMAIFSMLKNKKYLWIIIISLIMIINVIEILSSSLYFSNFNDILSINNLNLLGNSIYVLIYMLFFVLDDFVLFFIMFMIVLNKKNNKIFKSVGSIFFLIIGLLIILNK